MDNPLINILTRTSNRPEAFQRCLKSITSQEYKNWKMYVHYDNQETQDYILDAVKDADVMTGQVVTVYSKTIPKDPKIGDAHAPYNLYMNRLISSVSHGFIMCLDDDDLFTNEFSLSVIANRASESHLLVWRTEMPYGIVPNDHVFSLPVLIPQQVTSCSYLYHSKHKWAARWDCVKESDYRCAQALSRLLPMKKIDAALVKVPSVGMGDKKDG